MATKSISKNITIKSNAAGIRLAKAIEKSEKISKTAPRKMNRGVQIVTDSETILKMFGD